MIKEAIEKILQLAPTEQFEIDGRKYTGKGIVPVLEPTPTTIKVSTLTGLVDYMSGVDSIESGSFLHIIEPTTVILHSPLIGTFRQRTSYIGAEITEARIPVNQDMDIERFLISLLTFFDKTEDRDTIIKIVSNLRDEAVTTSADDGVTQTVTVKRGINFGTEITVPSPSMLRPFRTFREVEQPVSPFIFRLRGGGQGRMPTCLLSEVDGEGWKLTAIANIKAWLQGKLPDIKILA